jgi:hypothetical protein
MNFGTYIDNEYTVQKSTIRQVSGEGEGVKIWGYAWPISFTKKEKLNT